MTDRPEVHSSGFHIAFDLAADSSLGYILPTWIGEGAAAGKRAGPPSQLQGAAAASGANISIQGTDRGGVVSGTVTVLPLKRQMRGPAGAALRRRFEDLQPTLLLFLQVRRRLGAGWSCR